MNADIQRYAQTMPQYREALDFLHNILDFQAALQAEIDLCLHVEPATARHKWRSGQPLFSGEPMAIPADMVRTALAGLRSLLPAGKPGQMALDRLLASDFIKAATLETLPGDLVAGSEATVRRLAQATSIEPETLVFLLQTVLAPFFQKQAMPYREWVEAAGWRRGVCPMCGSEPWLARLAQADGRRILACALCRTEWAFDRLRCPFCESGDQPFDTPGVRTQPFDALRVRTQPQLRYFTVNGDEAHRVDCCDRCRRYLKTVDERVSGRPANLPVEDVITAYLDALAGEQGYHK
ncbi:MAG: formate dehydrogenase accessory protein FdhE [Chloroflexota bacterium]